MRDTHYRKKDIRTYVNFNLCRSDLHLPANDPLLLLLLNLLGQLMPPEDADSEPVGIAQVVFEARDVVKGVSQEDEAVAGFEFNIHVARVSIALPDFSLKSVDGGQKDS